MAIKLKYKSYIRFIILLTKYYRCILKSKTKDFKNILKKLQKLKIKIAKNKTKLSPKLTKICNNKIEQFSVYFLMYDRTKNATIPYDRCITYS